MFRAESALDRGACDIQRPLLSAGWRDRRAEADPEAVSADLDRRGGAKADAARRREARRRVELECANTCGDRRTHEGPRRALCEGGPRSGEHPPVEPDPRGEG